MPLKRYNVYFYDYTSRTYLGKYFAYSKIRAIEKARKAARLNKNANILAESITTKEQQKKL